MVITNEHELYTMKNKKFLTEIKDVSKVNVMTKIFSNITGRLVPIVATRSENYENTEK